MADSTESPPPTVDGGRWLLLIHSIPPKPDYARVRIRRRLEAVGAVPVKNSVYVLPATDDAMEDFQWIRRDIVDAGGEGAVCVTRFVDGLDDNDIESLFRARADAEYDRVIEAAGSATPRGPDASARLKRQLAAAIARDFFGASRRTDAERAVEGVAPTGRVRGDRARGLVVAPRGATWVTRRDVGVDRMASAWLIRRFLDPKAAFRFVPARNYKAKRGDVLFDTFEGTHTHEGDRCTFEVLVHRFGLDDPALAVIAEIVHDIDCKDDKFARAETPGVARMIAGIRSAHATDAARLDAGTTLFDGLYAAWSHRRA